MHDGFPLRMEGEGRQKVSMRSWHSLEAVAETLGGLLDKRRLGEELKLTCHGYLILSPTPSGAHSSWAGRKNAQLEGARGKAAIHLGQTGRVP